MNDQSAIRLLLREVRMERFKAAFKLTNPIDFRPANVIIGRNGSGKSTVIEALQWIDTAIRLDVPRACLPYTSVRDLINVRSPKDNRYFRLSLTWQATDDSQSTLVYTIQISEDEHDPVKPRISEENLALRTGPASEPLITTRAGERYVHVTGGLDRVPYGDTDRLALDAASVWSNRPDNSTSRYIAALRDYWSNAVFLRLNPVGLAQGSRAVRPAHEPLLDQEGRNLPALLGELSRGQRRELIAVIQDILPDMDDVNVTRPRRSSDEAYFSLLERVRYRGRTGVKSVPIPSWMLSEGTRRITAILALLFHRPPPSLLCIEEIENGLDPWSVQRMLKELRSASGNGVQVILTTHSPWLLDHVDIADILHVQREEGETIYSRFADRGEVSRYQGRVPPGAIYVTEG